MSWYAVKDYIKRIERSSQGDTSLLLPWLEEKGIIKYTLAAGELLWKRVLTTGRIGYTFNPYREPYDPPFLDHGRLFKSRGGKVWLVYHPYEPEENVRPAVLAWAEKHGFKAEVHGASQSWYYPGRTCMVTVWKEEMF